VLEVKPRYSAITSSAPWSASASGLARRRSSLWHGGGANQTTRPRLGVILEYAAGWLRQQENHCLAVPRDIARELPERLQELLGYNITRRSWGTLTAATRAGSRCQPSADVELGVDIVGIPGTYAELDVGVLDGLTAFHADDLADDAVPRLVVVQGDRRASVIKPFVSPGEHGRKDGEEVAAPFGEQVLVRGGLSW